MIKISKEEVLKIAAISQISVSDAEADSLAGELEAVLSYAERVAQLTGDAPDALPVSFNVYRPDEVKKADNIIIEGQGVDAATGYFVVPLILDQQ